MMVRDRARGQTVPWELALIWLGVCSALVVGQSELVTTTSSSPSALDDESSYITDTDTDTTTATNKAQQEITRITPPLTERTSNAIPEAEQNNSEQMKKYNGKKLDRDSASQSSDHQLDLHKTPYPYLKKTSLQNKDDAIRQSKRSGTDTGSTLTLNGTLQLSVLPKNPSLAKESLTRKNVETITTTTDVATVLASIDNATVSSEPPTLTSIVTVSGEPPASNWTATTISVLEDEASTSPTLYITSLSEDVTTIQNTQLTNESTFTQLTEKNSAAEETDTERVTPLVTTQSIPTTLTQPSTTTATTSCPFTISTDVTATWISRSEAPPHTVASDTNIPTTITESLPTITTAVNVESSTTRSVEQDHSTITTSGAAVPPTATTITTTEPSIQPASTKIVPAITLLPVTTLTTTSMTMTTTATTAKMSTNFISPKRIAATTITLEPYSAVITWQDKTSDTTTELFSPTPSPEDVTLLVRIVLEGSWQDVCSKLPILRQSLTDLLNNSIDKPISTRQIIFHQTQCSENLTPTLLVTDTQLTPVLVYVVDENGNFDGKLTKIIPSLHESSPIGFPLKIHSVTLVPEADSGNAIAVVIVSCVAFICLMLLAGLLFIMRKRQGRFNYGERCRPVSLDAYSLDSVSAYNSVRRSKAVTRSSKRSYGNPAFEDSSVTPTHPLNFSGISIFCNDANAVAEEFACIPQIHSKIEELPPEAEIKNRYANVIPLPETRVPLQRINSEPLSEYINASYVRGPKNDRKYYIACQAPTEATVADFWRMIWEQQSKVIIMLTDLVENGVDKCTEYIPPLEVSDCHRLYGDYQVTLKKREAKEKYAISTLHLKNLENNTFREVSHIWYLWPVSGVPTDAAGLIAVLLEARALQRGAAGPILMHCSPGTGRTGTLLALDLCIRQYEVTRTVDVPRVVYTIRRDRAGAVQTKEQYLFIYKGLNLYASKLAGGGIDST